MNEHFCCIQGYGKDFDPKLFIKKTNFGQKEILFTSALGLPQNIRQLSKANRKYYGIFDIFDLPYLVLLVSSSQDFSQQVKDATTFIKKHFYDLQNLCSHQFVQDVLIRFVYKPKDNSFSKQLFVTSELENLIAEVGIGNIIIG